MLLKRKTLVLFLVAFTLLGLAGWLVLTNPDNPFTRLFSRKISDVDARIIIGPYPSEKDFRILKSNKVGLIVSLLDSAIPYEANLIKEEQARAERFGIPLKNFPMSSILGQKFGNYYDESATKAAEAIAAATEKVYLHCYLGMHRIQVVRDNLTKLGIEAGMYSVRKGDRQESSLLLDKAEAAYAAGLYAEAMDSLAKIGSSDLTVNAKLLRAWCHYRMNQVAEAKAIFETFLLESPDNASANTGLGYCFLREGDLARAEQSFTKAIEKEPKNADALGGLGLTLYRAGRLADAARNLEASIKIAPNAELQSILDQIRNQK